MKVGATEIVNGRRKTELQAKAELNGVIVGSQTVRSMEPPTQ